MWFQPRQKWHLGVPDALSHQTLPNRKTNITVQMIWQSCYRVKLNPEDCGSETTSEMKSNEKAVVAGVAGICLLLQLCWERTDSGISLSSNPNGPPFSFLVSSSKSIFSIACLQSQPKRFLGNELLTAHPLCTANSLELFSLAGSCSSPVCICGLLYLPFWGFYT